MDENNISEFEQKGTQISEKLFGGIFEYDGAGYYPGLELLNLVFGTRGNTLLPAGGEVHITRNGQDFARRLVWDEAFERHPKRREVLLDEQTENTIKHLLACLQLPIPGSNKRPASWQKAHFFPYSKSLIHWDARERPKGSNRIKLERIYLRGAGAMAYKVLRMDPDSARLYRCRQGFQNLFPAGGSPLEQLASELAKHGEIDEVPRQDEIEKSALAGIFNDTLEDVFRDGMSNILGHVELSAVARIRSVMNWTAFWLDLTQHRRAAAALEKPATYIVCDCGASNAQLRRASQRCLKDLQALIVAAFEKTAADMNSSTSKKRRNNIRGFFWATAATIKLLNSWRGRRHFTLGLDILETLVLAACDKKKEIPFDDFVEAWLFEKCGLIIGRRSAERSGILATFDASIFEENENQLASQMSAAGLLTQYSDATRMVSTGGLQ